MSTRTDTLFPYTTLFRSFERLEPVFLRMGGRHQAERRGGEKQKANWHVVTPVPMGEPKGCPKNARGAGPKNRGAPVVRIRSGEHTSELQSLMRNSYAVIC